MTNHRIKTRFAPSPTGALHLGNVRTALFSALRAWGGGGHFLLRIEDTDRERYRPEAADALMRDLRWLGLEWQEGPGVGGGHEPYRQFERAEIYARYYRELERSGAAYPCFCTERELEMNRRVQRAAGRPPRYPGTCARLSAEEVERKRAAGVPATLRFRVPANSEVRFTDGVHGEQRFRTDDLGDFIIRRADGTAAYLFANALDDALMGVTDVLRGDDHLTNTPRQLLLLQALELPAPRYTHMGLILGDDGAPLSKRNGSRSVADLEQAGYLPEAVLNYLARIGHTYESEQLLSLEALAQAFAPERLSAAPSRFDPQHLLHWQEEAVQAADGARLRAWMGIDALVPPGYADEVVGAIRGNVRFPEEARDWATRIFGPPPPLDEAAQQAVQGAGASYFTAAAAAAREGYNRYRGLIEVLQARLEVKGKRLFMPLRAALTGRCSGPELQPVVDLMGSERIVERLERAAEMAATGETGDKAGAKTGETTGETPDQRER
ncbi:glutamate--tRNA ligase [Halorhodospira abdelmalekii]|uniref:glutamate--tRNA ligase n=1 Tax=Halorhodospira abdelmalekii TaxID=421629 RepID=UPI001906E15A|nr:glutamate--tRNA ligase [Halorhodospira abdelmalekii]MBK1735413.1 glutamate--tRNA ligase [Halorhodospira abdelmalekii]